MTQARRTIDDDGNTQEQVRHDSTSDMARDLDVEQSAAASAPQPDQQEPGTNTSDGQAGDKDAVMTESEQPEAKQPSSVRNIFKQDQSDDFLARIQHGNAHASSQAPPTAAPSATSAPTTNTSGPVASTSSLTAAAPPRTTTPSFEGRVTRSQTAAERDSDKQKGLVGLYNLGNTCFMNAALQCMSNTKELKEYFVSGAYKSEINASNPLGMGGAMAKAFGELLTKLWASSNGAWHPREFKTVLSRFSPQFIGYAQQDTQELLAFLLDGLHEDLNRIIKKPYIEAPDWEGGGLKEMVMFAHKQWEIYKMRNDSVIVDLFQGQYRSTLVCPTCAKVSIKFDPFMYLTLPIPNRKSFVRKVRFIGLDRPPVDAEMRFTGETSIEKMKRTLCQWFDVADPKSLIACDVFSKSFYRVYTDIEAASDISTTDVTFIYQLAQPLVPVAPASRSRGIGSLYEPLGDLEQGAEPPQQMEEFASLPVFSVIGGGKARNNFDAYPSRSASRTSPLGDPLMISVPKAKINDVDAIQEIVIQAYLKRIPNPEALQAYLEEVASGERASENQASEPTTTSAMDDWELLADSNNVIPDVAHTTSTSVDENMVAEISNDGETVTVVPDVNAEAPTDHSGRSESAHLVDVRLREAQEAQKLKRTPKKPFSLHFIVHREDQAPTTLKPDDFESKGEDLHARAKRLAAGEPSQGSSMQSETRRQWPLVYSGGAVVCSWTEQACEKIFGGEEDPIWAQGVETFVDPELVEDRKPEAKKIKRTLTIEDCLNEFTKEEQLGESDPWYCPNCKEFKQASKKFDLWKVPDILVVHLKRFSSGRISRDKIDSFIDFPIDGLDLTERVEGAKAVQRLHEEEFGDDEEGNANLMESISSLDANDDAVESDAPIYDLYAVDNHFGGLGGGHYTAHAKNPEDEKWYYFDDSSVRPVRQSDEVKSTAAYLLFYRRRTVRPIGGKSREKVRQRVKEVEESEKNGLKNGDAAASQSGAGQGSSMDVEPDDSITVVDRRGQSHLGWDDDALSSGANVSTSDYEYGDTSGMPGALPSYEESSLHNDDHMIPPAPESLLWSRPENTTRFRNEDDRSSDGAQNGSLNLSDEDEAIAMKDSDSSLHSRALKDDQMEESVASSMSTVRSDEQQQRAPVTSADLTASKQAVGAL